MKDLFEMPRVVVNVKTQEEFIEYLGMCSHVNWTWCDGEGLEDLNDYIGDFEDNGSHTCVGIEDGFSYGNINEYKPKGYSNGYRIITLQELKEILSDWEVGDILIDEDNDEIKVMGKIEIQGEIVYLTSIYHNFLELNKDCAWTKEQYENEGYKLKPKKIKLTKEEIAIKLNISPELLEIGE